MKIFQTIYKPIIVVCFIHFFITNRVFSQSALTPECNAVHNIGKLVLKSNTASLFGGTFDRDELDESQQIDCFTGSKVFEFGAEFPKNSGIACLSVGGVWFGGIIKSDTLFAIVQPSPDLYKSFRSTLDPNSENFKEAVSEQDIISVFEDNNLDLAYVPPNYKPLNIQITKKSYAWSYGYTEDFVLFDIEIRNVGDETIKKAYMGIILEFAVGYYTGNNQIGNDDIGGFLQDNFSLKNCGSSPDKLILVWGADNDGDPINNKFYKQKTYINGEPSKSATSVSGVLFLDNLNDKYSRPIKMSYNWWSYYTSGPYNYGPQRKDNLRQFEDKNTYVPISNGDYYFTLSNGEKDYDQIYSASILPGDSIWNFPDQQYVNEVSSGIPSISHHLSVGPFDIPPGAILKLPFAYVAGEDFHTIPSNGDNLPLNPDAYYSNLDFSDIANNAQWAKWIYDNPGVDTDGDGDSGRYKICVLDSQLVDDVWEVTSADTFWYQGDGVPDWKAAGPPPAPYVWLEPIYNGVKVRFNGTRSETEKDLFTQIVDFEGYNIYMGRDDRETSLSIVASMDYENYDKFVYDEKVDLYIVDDVPLTIDEIRCAYADSCLDTNFDPLDHDRQNPISSGDTLIYFRKHSYNVNDGSISKVYPNARDPRLVDIDSLVPDDYTEDGYYKFFEYEFEIHNLLPTVSYWINVTAFDFGSPKSGLPALESSKTLDIQPAYPLTADNVDPSEQQKIYVYPNPYRIDANYRGMGFEGRTEDDRPDYRVRELNFVNLPPKCEIKIFSLDGDLIRHISHNVPAGDATSSHDQWDLITRNTQMVVSGLYYWTVEFPDGEVQMGKFVVIM